MDSKAEPASPEPRLPLELVLLILELVTVNFPKKTVQLVLISRSVQFFIDPILYESVVLRDDVAVSDFARTVSNLCVHKSPSFFQEHVKRLCFTGVYDPEDLQSIATACTSVQSIAFYRGPNEESFQLCKNLPLRRYSGRYHPGLLDPQQPIFPNLTHLDTFTVLLSQDRFLIPKSLPLTHLSLDESVSNDASLIRLGQKLPSTLKVCIRKTTHDAIAMYLSESCAQAICEHDPRIVFVCRKDETLPEFSEHDHLIYREPRDFDSDWGRRPVGERDVWELAEEIVERRAGVWRTPTA